MNAVWMDQHEAIGPNTVAADPTASPAARAKLLMREARTAAVEQLLMLEAAIKVVRDLSFDIAQGGDVYSVGARGLATQLAEDLLWRGKSLEAFTARAQAARLAR